MNNLFWKSVGALSLACAIFAWGVCAAEDEGLPDARSSTVLPANLQKGTSYTTADKVGIDGLFYTFELQTAFGVYKVTSSAMLKLRIDETITLEKIGEIKGSEQFFGALKDSVVQVPVQTAKLISEPVQSVKNMGANVGKKFQSVGRFFTSERDKSDYEDNTFKDISIGSQKRQIAVELGLDVYSSNPKVQTLLDRMARARAMGGAPLRLAGMAVPPLGMALNVLRLRRDINEDLAKKTPSELFAMNNSILKKMSISEDLREDFLNNESYSPRHKTAIVADLEAMKDVKGISKFLISTLSDSSEEEALFAENQADMMLVYHKTINPIQEINLCEGIPVCTTNDGSAVIFSPVDLFYFNGETSKVLQNMIKAPYIAGAAKKLLVTNANLSEQFSAKIAAMGITVVRGLGEKN